MTVTVQTMDSEAQENSWVPEWAAACEPGTLNLAVLDQAVVWVTAQAVPLRIAEMSTAHLRNVVAFLSARAEEFYTSAVLTSLWAVVLADASGDEVAGERLAWELTGRSIADLEPAAWLESTALVRALRRELAARGND
ncbi:hypothetical protein [Cellulomonas carbonis]|uniref:Uncharacterized protein n=1 Tax=Cellulomonas carbonis T26 TaxID=947969 RepID=A0A0A0BTG0_9CELL|nr:hypothetical protein [Cellulomonas carbonis]KGM11693.1 hypothetical protein N868_07795 [Cellulomonas carbonis T26]GGB98976.1 hypothetical protein GCM10010972_09750 [Cellulomonas carbonis]